MLQAMMNMEGDGEEDGLEISRGWVKNLWTMTGGILLTFVLKGDVYVSLFGKLFYNHSGHRNP